MLFRSQTRTTPNSDIGADEFTPLLFDVKPVTLINPQTPACYSASEQVTIKLQNYTGNAIDFNFNPVTVTVELTGPSTQTITTTINNNSLNGNNPLAAFSFINVPVGTVNMASFGNYNFKCYSTWTNDQNLTNDTINNITRINDAPQALPQTVSFTGYNGNNLGILFNGWKEGKGSLPTGTTSLWTTWANFGTPGNVNAVVSLNSNTHREWIVGPKIIPGINTVLTYKAAVTQIASSTNQPAALGADDKFYVMLSTDCGASFQKIDSITQLTNLSNNLPQNQFSVQLGTYAGQNIIIGFMASDGLLIDGSCDFHLDDINLENNTNYDLSVTQLTSPLFQYCYAGPQSIVVKLKNTGSIPIDFVAENGTLNAVISGPAPQSFSLPITTGTLTPGTTQTFTITNSFDLSVAGQYQIKAYLSIPSGDINPSNDTLIQLIYPQNPGVSFLNSALNVCVNDSIQLNPQVQINGIGSTTLPAFTSNQAPVSIPDNDIAGVNSTINIAGSGGFASQIVGVKIDSLLHTFDGDLVLTLIAPNGSSMVLSQNNGGGGDNYISTLFSSSASNPIISGSAPFTGAFLPQTSFDQLSGSVNGNWVLNVKDISQGDVGALVKWSLLFKEENTLANFTWSPTSVLSSTSLNPYASPDTTTTFTFTAIDMNGCTATSTVTVIVNTTPVVNLTSLSDSVCLNSGNVVLQGIPTGGVFTGNGVDSTGTFNPSLAGVGIANLYYEITDSNSCVGIDTITVVVLDTPQVSFQLPLSFVCSQDAPFTLSGALPIGGVYSGVGISNGTTFDPASATLGQQFLNYAYTDNFGCGSTVFDTIEVSLCLSLNNQSEKEIKAFPNPARDFVVLENLQFGNKIQLMDLNGKILFSEVVVDVKKSIDVSNFARGVYFICIENDSIFKTIKKLLLD